MEKDLSQKISQIVGDEQIKRALELGYCIVRVSYDNNQTPITLLSKERLTNKDYIEFVESLGIYAKEYNIRGEIKNKE